MRRKCFIVLFCLFAPMLHAMDSKMEKRYLALTKEIRCVVCQGQSIADSSAPLAKDLRKKIRQQMLDNKSDKKIKNYLASRYGEFILLRPRINKQTLLLWSFPFLCFMFLGLFLYRIVLRR